MKYLLDTCVLLWALENNKDKLRSFNEVLQNPRNYIAVSVVSLWEIIIKKSLGKLNTPGNIVEVVEQTGFTWINLETRHIQELELLPKLHNDPFDRLLIAQSKSDDLKLLSADMDVLKYF